MGFIKLFISLWPFFKEIFVGEKIQEVSPTRRGSPPERRNRMQGNSNDTFVVKVLRWCINKMQMSKRFLALVMLFLLLSVFVNYKLMNKLSVATSRKEEKTSPSDVAVKDPKEVPTIPLKDNTEKDVLLEQTVRELKDLYGETP